MTLNLPILGINMPNMGSPAIPSTIERPRRSLASALFTTTQQRVLALLFGQPERSFFATEIIARVATGSGAVQRELQKLVEAGLVRVTRLGTQKHYQADPAAAIFSELCLLVRKTMGLAEPLREALGPLREKIELALVYGSVAKGRDKATSDIDLLIVGQDLMLEEVYAALAAAEKELGRSIHPTLYSPEELETKLSQGNSFLTKVLGGETLLLIGKLPNVDRGAR